MTQVRRSGTVAILAAGVGLSLLLSGGPAQSAGPMGATAIAGVTSAVASPQDTHVVAVGDIASDSRLDDAVADLVADLDPEWLLLLGDVAYPNGSEQDFASYFAPDWARFSDMWMPVPGNHEYQTPGAAGYRQFFGIPSGPLHSTRKVGSWRVIGLDSEVPASGRQLAWLRATLAAFDGEPTLVMWHRARYSSGSHGDERGTDPLWDVVKGDPDVRLVLWGHDHDYERMAVPVAGREALRAMVVGTGGGTLRPTPDLPARPWRQFFVDHTTGVLDLQLGATSFSWRFVTAGGAVLDKGSEQVTRPWAAVKLRAVQKRSALRVNVNPNMGAKYWTFKVQRRSANRTWVTKKILRTRRATEVRTVNMRAGTYRVRVKAKFGYRGMRSRAVVLKR